MCGRYTLYETPSDLAEYFSATLQCEFAKSYNIAPTAIVPVLIALEGEGRVIVPMRWGLIPSWHKAGQKQAVLNNAKIETVDTKPSFRVSFKRHRCLILANGFFEWDSTTTPKQPYYFQQKNMKPIALGGIWDRWVSDNSSVDSCCIITEPANALVSSVHERMPAIILPELYDEWLDANNMDTRAIKIMAQHEEAYQNVICYPVTTKMNRVAFNNDGCIKSLNSGNMNGNRQ